METKDILKMLREKNKWSLQDVSEKTGISYSVCQKYESGARGVGVPALQKFADIFDVSTDYLLGRPNAEPPKDPVDEFVEKTKMPSKEKAALAKWLSLDPTKRQSVLDIMAEIVREYETANLESKPDLFVFRRCSEYRVSAGIGYDLNDPDAWRDITVIDTPEAHQADFVVQIDGDSMEPEYHDGDYVYVKIDPDVSIGKVGIFQDVDKGYIKMRGRDCLISLNKDYDDIPLTEEMKCVGMVIGVAELPEK